MTLYSCGNYFYPPLRWRSLSRGCYNVPQPGWSGPSLCIHGIVAENHCDGGRREGSVLSWHPLPNNWMAYQVTPRSLIALFRPWLAETPPAPPHTGKKAHYCLHIINRPAACLLSHVCIFSISCEAQGQQQSVKMQCCHFALPFSHE